MQSSQLAMHEESDLPDENSVPLEAYERLVADHDDPGGPGSQASPDSSRRHAEGRRRQQLADEHVAAGARPGQDELPGSVAILGGEQIPRHDASDQRQSPRTGEGEHHERDREPRRMNPDAVQGVGWDCHSESSGFSTNTNGPSTQIRATMRTASCEESFRQLGCGITRRMPDSDRGARIASLPGESAAGGAHASAVTVVVSASALDRCPDLPACSPVNAKNIDSTGLTRSSSRRTAIPRVPSASHVGIERAPRDGDSSRPPASELTAPTPDLVVGQFERAVSRRW